MIFSRFNVLEIRSLRLIIFRSKYENLDHSFVCILMQIVEKLLKSIFEVKAVLWRTSNLNIRYFHQAYFEITDKHKWKKILGTTMILIFAKKACSIYFQILM